MNMQWLQQPWMETLGWTLLHSLWELSLIAALAAVALMLLHRRSAHARYLLCYCLLITMTAAPIATYKYVWANLPPTVAASPAISAQASGDAATQRIIHLTQTLSSAAPLHISTWQTVLACLRALPPYAALLYLIGTILLTLRLLVGYHSLRRLRIRALPAAMYEPLLAQLCQRLRLATPVLLRRSDRVEVPTVIGAFRPMILLPLSAMTGLSPDHLTYLLLHELAHIRRHDYAANLAQSVVETLLFYHPAVAWLSAQVRQEREHCCDDITIAAAGNRHGYAQALATMESLRGTPARAPGGLALGANGGFLLRRIQRILNVPTPKSLRQRIVSGSSIAATAGALLLTVYMIGCSRKSASPPAQTQAANEAERPQVSKEPPAYNADTQTTVEEVPTMITDLVAADQPLQRALESLASKNKINLVVNWSALKEAGVEKTTPASVYLRDVPFNKALMLLLDSVGGHEQLAASMDKNVLTVSTQDDLDARAPVVMQTYDIHDLLAQGSSGASAAGDAAEPPSPEMMRAQVVQAIVNAIEQTITPDSWKDRGGSIGSIMEIQGQLIVRQTAKNQAGIRNVLNLMRNGHLQITIDTRILMIDDAAFAALQLPPQPSGKAQSKFLSDAELRSFLSDMQADPATINLASPRITLFSGGEGSIQAFQARNAKNQTAVGIKVTAAVSADRRYVIMNLHPSLGQPVMPAGSPAPDPSPAPRSDRHQPATDAQQLAGVFSVPDKGTLLVAGLTASTQTEARHVIFLVRPSVVIPRDATNAMK